MGGGRAGAYCQDLINQTSVADYCSLADYHSHAVVDEDSFPYCGSRMDIYAGKKAIQVR